jgi:hypothetical protein
MLMTIPIREDKLDEQLQKFTDKGEQAIPCVFVR